MTKKIIHILTHSPRITKFDLQNRVSPPPTSNPLDAKYAIKLDAFPNWVIFPTNDWHVQVAEETLLRTDEYIIECWRPNQYINEPYERRINGICHRVFPSYKSGLGKYGNEVSPSMLNELSNQKENFNLIIHLHQYTQAISKKIANTFSELPIVGSHLGGATFRSKIKYEKSLVKKAIYYILDIPESKAIRKMDFLTVGSREELNSISEYHNSVDMFPANGINFSDYYSNRKESRTELGINQDKRVMLHVSRFIKLKGIPTIIQAYEQLSKEFDLDLYIIGGNKEDELYEYCTNSGAIVKERMPHDKLNLYYSAADVFVTFPNYDRGVLASAGIGTATLESLASETPVVSNGLGAYIGQSESVGFIPKNYDDLIHSLRLILNGSAKFTNLNEKASKYYDWSFVIEGFLSRYEILSNKYYT